MTKLVENLEDVVGELKPEIMEDYKTLKAGMKDQKEDNELLNKKLVHLRKETESQRSKVKMC